MKTIIEGYVKHNIKRVRPKIEYTPQIRVFKNTGMIDYRKLNNFSFDGKTLRVPFKRKTKYQKEEVEPLTCLFMYNSINQKQRYFI